MARTRTMRPASAVRALLLLLVTLIAYAPAPAAAEADDNDGESLARWFTHHVIVGTLGNTPW